jgi:hypothetical protein
MIYITNIFERDMMMIMEEESKNLNVGENYLENE